MTQNGVNYITCFLKARSKTDIQTFDRNGTNILWYVGSIFDYVADREQLSDWAAKRAKEGIKRILETKIR